MMGAFVQCFFDLEIIGNSQNASFKILIKIFQLLKNDVLCLHLYSIVSKLLFAFLLTV